MPSTNKTPNVLLSQFLPTDKPAWLSDYNNDMLAIDAAIGKKEAEINTATSQINVANAAIATANTGVTNNTSAISAINASRQHGTATATIGTPLVISHGLGVAPTLINLTAISVTGSVTVPVVMPSLPTNVSFTVNVAAQIGSSITGSVTFYWEAVK